MNKLIFSSLLCMLFFYDREGFSQGTLADYQRAETADTAYVNKEFNKLIEWAWLPNENRFWYQKAIKGGKAFILVDAAKKTKQQAFDHQKLAKALTEKTRKAARATNLPFDRITFRDQRVIEFVFDSSRWQFNSITSELKQIERLKKQSSRYWGGQQDEKSGKVITSPDSAWVAFIRESNVFIRDRKTKREFKLSIDGSAGEFYSSSMQWSPDSKKLMAYKVRPGENHTIYFVESSPVDQLQPKLQSRDYLKPGDALPIRMPQLFLIDEKKQVKIDHDLFAHQFRLSDFEWRNDNNSFTFEYNERGHQRYKVIEVKAPSGEVNVLIDEQSKTFIDYAGKSFRYDVADGKEIIWMSERDGWNHLYLYDGATGKVKNQITKGEWVVRSVEYVDEKAKNLVFGASGMDEGIDPYMISYFRINFDGSGLTRLTEKGLQHKIIFSPDHSYFIDMADRVDVPTVTTLRRADGSEVMPLQKLDITSLLEAGWRMTEVLKAKGRDGITDIWGYIIKPSNFDPSKKYPVIEYIYAGPHSSHVPKTFNVSWRNWHPLAELGFIIVQIDGMGTSNRSKAFHDVCWKNIKDAGFPDRIIWIKEAAKTRSYMDIDRMGIFGNSAGGQNSMGGLLHYPEFYKVAVSSSGCHDNRMDKMWWNELWMGYPVGPEYAASSNVTHASKLQGKLLLIVGELDDNVDPSSTMQVVNALIKADKNFDFLFVPGMGHSLGGTYGEKKRRDFFVKNLLGVDPPDWNVRYAAR